jgi:sugar phosphate isomerase/epimerase
MHARLSVDALSSHNWSFEQDLALWRELGVHHAGLLIAKLSGDRAAKTAQLRAAGIRPSTLITGCFDLGAPESWDANRKALNDCTDLVAMMGGSSVYFTPGRTTGAPWSEVLELLAQAVEPSVRYSEQRGVALAIEPSLRTDVSFVNTMRDAIDVAERTGLKLIVDFGNCWMERDLREVLRLAAPHICLVQICDVRIGRPGQPSPGGRVHLGDGDLPLRRLMHEVLDTGYEGLFDLEVLGPSIEAEGYATALPRGVERASALLASLGI